MRSKPVLLFAAISLALHLGWVLCMPVLEQTDRPEERWVEASFEVEEPAAATAAVIEEPSRVEPAVRETAPSMPPKTRSVSRAPSPASPSSPRPTPPLAASASIDVVQPAAAEPTKPAKVPVLSPRMAAASSIDAFTRAPGLRCAPPEVGRHDVVGPTDCADDNGEAAQAALQDDLNTIAKAVPHLKVREAPKLKRRSDGSFAFDGHVFQALLQPDGQVEFTDTSERAQLQASLTPFKVVADVNDLVEKQVLGRELYSSEKAWFLEQTRELRTQLAGEARRRELQQSKRALERTLQDVLADRALSIAQKHDAVFLIWQDCGEDAEQKAHRRSVEAFVRRYMPSGSALGFRADELDRLNAERGALQRFAPYSDSQG